MPFELILLLCTAYLLGSISFAVVSVDQLSRKCTSIPSLSSAPTVDADHAEQLESQPLKVAFGKLEVIITK